MLDELVFAGRYFAPLLISKNGTGTDSSTGKNAPDGANVHLSRVRFPRRITLVTKAPMNTMV
jgi:hypothetical protein